MARRSVRPEISPNHDMLEKAYEMVCLAGLFFKHAGRPEIAERLRIAVRGWDADESSSE